MPSDILQLNPALVVLILSLVAPVVTVLAGTWRPGLTGPTATATTAMAVLAVLWSFTQDDATFDRPWSSTSGLRWHLELDGLARMYALMATGVGLAVVVYSTRYLPLHLDHHHRARGEMPGFFGFLLLFMHAMVGLVMAQDVILLFLFWDLTAIASFFLIGYDREEEDSRSAAFMAMLVTGVTAVFVLVGSVMLWFETGTFSLPAMIDLESTSPTVGIAALLIVVGGLAKSAQVPLHFWLPRAMAAPTPVSAYLHSAAMVAAGVFLVGRFYPIIARFDWLLNGMLVVGLVSIAVGGVLALTRDALKQVLAYSTISQYGYVVFLFGLGSDAGITAATYYVLVHAIIKSGLFLTAGAVTEATGSRVLSRTGGLLRRMPLLAAGSGMLAAGLVALPLTAGFFKDELFFAAAYERGLPFGVAAVLGASLTFAYIGRFWMALFLGPPGGELAQIPGRMTWPVVALGALTVLFGLWTGPLFDIGSSAAAVSARADSHIDAAYHLDLRHENVMALVTWTTGVLLLVSRRRWFGLAIGWSTLGKRYGPERFYHWSLVALEQISDTIHRIEVRDLRSRIATILIPAGVLVSIALIVTPNSDAFQIGEVSRSDLPAITMLIAAAIGSIALAFPREHLRIALVSSTIGFSLATVYAFIAAPDVALVAVLVETILGIVIVGMLLLMPRSILRLETRVRATWRSSRRDILSAVFIGVMAFFVVWGVLSRPSASTYVIDRQIELTPSAHGSDIVTVILADFRGFDTLGEITVISLVLLGVLSLIRRGRLR